MADNDLNQRAPLPDDHLVGSLGVFWKHFPKAGYTRKLVGKLNFRHQQLEINQFANEIDPGLPETFGTEIHTPLSDQCEWLNWGLLDTDQLFATVALDEFDFKKNSHRNYFIQRLGGIDFTDVLDYIKLVMSDLIIDEKYHDPRQPVVDGLKEVRKAAISDAQFAIALIDFCPKIIANLELSQLEWLASKNLKIAKHLLTVNTHNAFYNNHFEYSSANRLLTAMSRGDLLSHLKLMDTPAEQFRCLRAQRNRLIGEDIALILQDLPDLAVRRYLKDNKKDFLYESPIIKLRSYAESAYTIYLDDITSTLYQGRAGIKPEEKQAFTNGLKVFTNDFVRGKVQLTPEQAATWLHLSDFSLGACQAIARDSRLFGPVWELLSEGPAFKHDDFAKAVSGSAITNTNLDFLIVEKRIQSYIASKNQGKHFWQFRYNASDFMDRFLTIVESGDDEAVKFFLTQVLGSGASEDNSRIKEVFFLHLVDSTRYRKAMENYLKGGWFASKEKQKKRRNKINALSSLIRLGPRTLTAVIKSKENSINQLVDQFPAGSNISKCTSEQKLLLQLVYDFQKYTSEQKSLFVEMLRNQCSGEEEFKEVCDKNAVLKKFITEPSPSAPSKESSPNPSSNLISTSTSPENSDSSLSSNSSSSSTLTSPPLPLSSSSSSASPNPHSEPEKLVQEKTEQLLLELEKSEILEVDSFVVRLIAALNDEAMNEGYGFSKQLITRMRVRRFDEKNEAVFTSLQARLNEVTNVTAWSDLSEVLIQKSNAEILTSPTSTPSSSSSVDGDEEDDASLSKSSSNSSLSGSYPDSFAEEEKLKFELPPSTILFLNTEQALALSPETLGNLSEKDTEFWQQYFIDLARELPTDSSVQAMLTLEEDHVNLFVAAITDVLEGREVSLEETSSPEQKLLFNLLFSLKIEASIGKEITSLGFVTPRKGRRFGDDKNNDSESEEGDILISPPSQMTPLSLETPSSMTSVPSPDREQEKMNDKEGLLHHFVYSTPGDVSDLERDKLYEELDRKPVSVGGPPKNPPKEAEDFSGRRLSFGGDGIQDGDMTSISSLASDMSSILTPQSFFGGDLHKKNQSNLPSPDSVSGGSMSSVSTPTNS